MRFFFNRNWDGKSGIKGGELWSFSEHFSTYLHVLICFIFVIFRFI